MEYKTSASVNGHIKDVKEKRQEEINPIVKGKRRKTKMKITTEKLDEMMQDYLEIWSQQYIIINKRQNTYIVQDGVNGRCFELSVVRGRIQNCTMDDCINNAKEAYEDNPDMLDVILEFEKKWYK